MSNVRDYDLEFSNYITVTNSSNALLVGILAALFACQELDGGMI